jgi:hypothetical protein
MYRRGEWKKNVGLEKEEENRKRKNNFLKGKGEWKKNVGFEKEVENGL